MHGDQPKTVSEDYVLYDGACPACSRYIAATGLARRRDIALIDARADPRLVAEHAAAGRKIDDGMVVAVDGVIHFGSDATHEYSKRAFTVLHERYPTSEFAKKTRYWY